MTASFANPNSPFAGTAAEALQFAEQALADALIEGADTGPARAALAAARKAAAAEREAAEQQARKAAQAAQAAAQQAEAAIVDQANDQVIAAIETIEAAPDADPLPEPVVPAGVRLAAEQLARARAALAQASVPYDRALDERSALRARVQPKTAELAAIRARRAAGDEQPGDAAAMTALSMDIEDLDRMLQPLEAAVAASVPDAERRAVADAQAALAGAQKRAEVDGMADRVRALEAHFAAQVRALRIAAADRGMTNLGTFYRASDALRTVANGGWL